MMMDGLDEVSVTRIGDMANDYIWIKVGSKARVLNLNLWLGVRLGFWLCLLLFYKIV